MTGLTIMLTGEALSWPDARRLLATDRLIAAINAFDRDSFPRARLRTLIPLMSNPAIHPDAVAPVCRAAAGLAAWVCARETVHAGGRPPTCCVIRRYLRLCSVSRNRETSPNCGLPSSNRSFFVLPQRGQGPVRAGARLCRRAAPTPRDCHHRDRVWGAADRVWGAAGRARQARTIT